MSFSITTSSLYSSGAITFSSLRSNFKETGSGQISASELRRNTSTLNSNPMVPDATENASISTDSYLSLSQFRNSIKYYKISQSGTDVQSNFATLNWNNNLIKNIKKFIYVTGTIGSTSPSVAAATFASSSYNLIIEVSGSIYGAGGSGGTLSTINGGNGGNALYVESSTGRVTINVTSTGKIYSGGGGGEKGAQGANGTGGTCYSTYRETTTVGPCCCGGPCPSCPPGWNRYDCDNRAGRCTFTQRRKSYCERYVTYVSGYTSGGIGGEGGNGGPGRGYNWNSPNSLLGSGGSPGTGGGGCGATNGYTGETGGNGGDWGSNGSNTTNTGNGGSSGLSISGLGGNFTVNNVGSILGLIRYS